MIGGFPIGASRRLSHGLPLRGHRIDNDLYSRVGNLDSWNVTFEHICSHTRGCFSEQNNKRTLKHIHI